MLIEISFHLNHKFNHLNVIGHEISNSQLLGKSQVTISVTSFAILKQKVTSRKSANNVVIIFGFTSAYSSLALNMQCQMKRLNIDNYLFMAFNDAAYKFCIEKSLVCHDYNSSFVLPKDDRLSDANYSSPLFKSITKVKSRAVLDILKLGVDVLWSDMDLFWKQNPVDKLLTTAKYFDIAVQSDSKLKENANEYLRINSGFYFVRSTSRSINAFNVIVNHASQSALTEQPSFYHVLCGTRQKDFVVCHNACYNPTLNISTVFLNRVEFPNGSFNLTNVSKADSTVILHYNWRTGFDTKVQSMKASGSWLLDSSNICTLNTRQRDRR